MSISQGNLLGGSFNHFSYVDIIISLYLCHEPLPLINTKLMIGTGVLSIQLIWPVSRTLSNPWICVEFHWTRNVTISMKRSVPWNSVELEVLQFRWQEQFHRIPWNLGCANFDDTIIYTWKVSYITNNNIRFLLKNGCPWLTIEMFETKKNNHFNKVQNL